MMKRTPTIILSLALLLFAGLVISNGGRWADGALFSGRRAKNAADSGRPLPRRYAKVSLGNDDSKVLAVILEASKGTASGYDVLYAGNEFPAELEQARKREAKVTKQSTRVVCAFSPLDVDPACDKNAGVTSSSASVAIRGCREGSQEIFCLRSRLALRQGDTRWQSNSTVRMNPSTSAEKAPLVRLNGKPKLTIRTRHGFQQKGNMGIALPLQAGEEELEYTKSGKPLEATVVIKKPDGEVVHNATAGLDKFVFG